MEKARGLLSSMTSRAKVPPSLQAICDAYLQAIPTDQAGNVPLDLLYGLLDNLKQAIAQKDASLFNRERGFKFNHIPDAIEFVESKEYLDYKAYVWPCVLDNLWRMFHTEPRPNVIVLGGAAGTAKSTTSWIATLYTCMLLRSMHNPHAEFGLMPSGKILQVFQGLKLDVVHDSLFNKAKNAIDDSPWFERYSPRKKDINDTIKFIDSLVEIKPLSGLVDSGLGKDILTAVITEINAMPEIKGSSRLSHSDKQVFSVGNEMFTTLWNRQETRFGQVGGGSAGWIIADSQRNFRGDFCDQKIVERDRDIKERGHSRILIIERTLWDAKPHQYPPDEPRFCVEMGTDHMPPRILEDPSHAEDPENTIMVPERHRKSFEEDIEQALKYLAGRPSSKSGRFIPSPAHIIAAKERFVARTGGASLFLHQDISFQELFAHGAEVYWEKLINEEYLKRLQVEDGAWAVHIDMAITGDAAGLAVIRIVDTMVVERGHFWSQEDSKIRQIENIESPVYCVDGVLRIRARSGERIDQHLLEELPLQLRKIINIKIATADWLESEHLLQCWAKNRILAGSVSVDKTPVSYYELKHAIMEGRIMWPVHDRLELELLQLQRLIRGGTVKIDHPPDGSKDVADAVAGAVGVLQRIEAKYRRADPIPEKGEEPAASEPNQHGSPNYRPNPKQGTTGTIRARRRW